VLPIAHKTFQHDRNLERAVGTPGNPLRQKEKRKAQKSLKIFFNFLKMSQNTFHQFAEK